MIIREATEDDNEALLVLTQACPMEGLLKLLIDRTPNYFSLLKVKGEYKVFVAISNQQIVGSFALVVKCSHIHQVTEKTGYLCDMKIAPAFRNSIVAFRLMKAMLAYMHILPIDFYLCVTARGNHLVETLLKGRVKIPGAFKVAEFSVYQLLPLKHQPSLDNSIQSYNEHFRTEVCELLNNYYKPYNFSTVFDINTNFIGDKSWIYLYNNKPVAFISVVDMSSFRQNRVMEIPFYLKIVMGIAKLIWPKITVPKEREAIKILDVQYFAYDLSFEKAADLLIRTVRHYTYVNGYTFLSYGIDARNPLAKKMKSTVGIVFQSVGYVFDFSRQKRWIPNSLVHNNFYQT